MLFLNLNKYTLINNAIHYYSTVTEVNNNKTPHLVNTKSNETTMNKNHNIKIDIRRNQTRMFSAAQFIIAYMNTCSGLRTQMILSLMTLITTLEKYYRRDAMRYCEVCKTNSNWLKVNIMKIQRSQDSILVDDWDNIMECPSILSEFFAELDKSRSVEEKLMAIRMVLSIFDIYHVILVKGAPKLETITNPYSGKEKYWDQIDIDRALKMLGINKDQIAKEFKNSNRRDVLHVSSAAGPNGQALWMSHVDAKAIYSDSKLRENMRRFAQTVGRLELFDNMETCIKIPQFFKLTEGIPKTSKLHFIYEKGNKVRTIAILDWWTQEFLSPLHEVIADILRNLQNDGTFDQDKIALAVKNFTSIGGSDLFSLDLTAATDRLPIALQVKILDILLGIPGIGEQWKDLLTERDFFLPDGKNSRRYAVGQPMGAKSSFPMLGLTHHIIVMEAAARVGLTAFKDYVILGDDIMIANKDVAAIYKEIMTNLGLNISEHKSIQSTQDTSRAAIAEICRRLFVNGLEITPLPMKLAVNVKEMGDLAYQLQEVMALRGFIDDPNNWKLFIINWISNNPNAQKQLALLNCLPTWATGMKTQYQLTTNPNYLINKWLESRGYTIEQFEQIFNFTVLVEQLKRLGAILANTENTYTTILKAAAVSKATGIGKEENQYLPIEDFDQETLDEWEIVDVFHPAIEAVKAECERINQVIMQMSVANESQMMRMLLSNVVDSLKISSYEIITDKAYADAKTTRKLLDTTFRNMERLLSESRNSDTLSYSIKLGKLNVIWNLSVSLTRNVTISRAAGQIRTSRDQMINVFNDFEKALK